MRVWKEHQKNNLLDLTVIIRLSRAKTYPTAIVQRAVEIK